MVDYDGRRFRPVRNAPTGEVSGETLFEYRQDGGIVWAEYAGGGVRRGHLIATVDADGGLDMRYHHVSAEGRLMTGICQSKLEILPDGRYRAHESWRWTSGDGSRGASVVEEVPKDQEP